MSTQLEQLASELASVLKKRTFDNSFKFRNQADALYHASRVAQLKPGTIVQFRSTEGLCSAVFVQFDDYCRAQLLKYAPNNGGHIMCHIVAASIIFDDMPEERIDEPDLDDEDLDDEDIADEFPRT